MATRGALRHLQVPTNRGQLSPGGRALTLSPPYPPQDTPKWEKTPPALPSRAGAGSTCPSSLQRGDLQGDHDPGLHRPNQRHCKTQRGWGHLAALPQGQGQPQPPVLTRVVDILIPAPLPPRRVPCLLTGLQVLVGCKEGNLVPNPPCSPWGMVYGVWGAQGGGVPVQGG